MLSCTQGKKVDVSNIRLKVKIDRFDHDLNNMATKPMAAQALFMQNKYGSPAGSIADTAYFNKLRLIFATRDYQTLKHEVDSVFPNLDKQNAELTEAFKYIKHYFPEKKLPKVFAYFSGFQAQTAVGNGYFGIGLDLFMGDSKFYRSPAIIQNFPMYISRRFTPDNITPRVVNGLITDDMFPESNKDKTMLDKMIYNGKVLYMMDMVLPDVADSTKIGFTTAQMKWCDQFKSEIWGYFLEENLLYETDEQKQQKFLGEAPFTVGLGERNESAPRLGVWTGWQIVRQYMDKHPEVTLPKLMAEPDAQKILNGSKYRPK